MSDLSERLRYCADSPCVGEPELRDLLREAAAALAKREPQIECPACGAVVKQVASATLGLELWQHWNWVCSYRQQAEARVSALQRENEELKVWKEDVVDAAIVHWTYDKSHTPREAINALMAQAYREALDPAVSEEAHKLVVRAEKAERELAEVRAETSRRREVCGLHDDGE